MIVRGSSRIRRFELDAPTNGDMEMGAACCQMDETLESPNWTRPS
jgi:hypothetical protein